MSRELTIFGALTAPRQKALPQQLSSVESRAGWWPIIRESWAGAWQHNVEIEIANVLTHPTVFACITLIASDIAKMRLRLVEMDRNGIWSETESAAFSPVLRIPNGYQTINQFIEHWMLCKLIHGNTYVLKSRDNRGVVDALYVLAPERCRPMVADDGAVYYELKLDHLSRQHRDYLLIPASEIIHDRFNTLYHPLVGISPIHACGLAAVLGLRIQTNSANLFTNGAMPSGILTAPGYIKPETAARLKENWQTEYSGDNVGNIAVLGDGLHFEPMAFKAGESQLTEQWKAAALMICAAFHVPPHMVAVEPAPQNANVEPLQIQYYSQALQAHIEAIEKCLDDGLGVLANRIDGRFLGTEFDLDDLLRMDTESMTDALTKAVGGALMTPNEARKKLNLKPVEGGDDVYSQQQNWSLAALAKRDEMALQPAATPATLPQGTEQATPPADETEKQARLRETNKAVLLWKVKERLDRVA